jgi:hypothetical protein
LQSISDVSAINPLVAFYDIYGEKREVLFFYFVPDTTRDNYTIFCNGIFILNYFRSSCKGFSLPVKGEIKQKFNNFLQLFRKRSTASVLANKFDSQYILTPVNKGKRYIFKVPMTQFYKHRPN